MRATPNQELPSIYVEKIQIGGRNSQELIRVPSWHPSMGPILRQGDGSFHVVLRTDLEVDLRRTQNYCVKLLAVYLRRMIIKIQSSGKVVSLRGSSRNNACPPLVPTGKVFCCNSLPECEIFFWYKKEERNILFVGRPVKEKYIH